MLRVKISSKNGGNNSLTSRAKYVQVVLSNKMISVKTLIFVDT